MQNQNQSKAKNEKMEAMRNRIKSTNPLIITNSKIDLQQLAAPSTPLFQQSNSPNSGEPKEQLSAFSAPTESINHYLKNAFEQKYEILEKLGEGANGIVRKCMDRETNEIFAVKIGKMEQEHMLALQAIVNMMKKLKHKSILNLRELYRDSNRCKYYHVIQYLPFPSLKQLLKQGYLFTPDKLKKIMKQLLSALQYFHKYYIVHRDIKTSNILYDVEGERLYVIDLGIINKTVQYGKRRNLWSNNGTLEYKAPEMLIGTSYNESVDNWAAGVVLYELVEGRTPFKEESHFDIIDNITEVKYTFNQELWKDIPLARQLVTMLLKPKSQRLSAKEALKAPWFQELDWEEMAIKSESPDSAKIKNLATSITFNKNKMLYGSVMLQPKKKLAAADEECQDLTMTIINPNLRMTSYQQTGKKQPLNIYNIQELLGIKDDGMIIDNS